MGTRLRVVQMFHNLRLGGCERQIYELSTRLPAGRFEVHVLTCAEGTGEYDALLSRHGIALHKVHKRAPIDLRYVLELRRKLAELKPDIVHSWMFTANMWGPLAACGLRPRPAIIVAERNAYNSLSPVRRLAYRLQARLADRVLGNAQGVKELWRSCGAPERKLLVIENGMEFARFDAAAAGLDRSAVLAAEGLDPALPLVLACGRLVPQKDHKSFIAAAAELQAQGVAAQYAVLGSGPLEAELRERIAAQGLTGRFHLLPARQHIEALLLCADVFCLPSLHEGFSNALAEALGCGLPCVSTRVSGSSELIEDGMGGSLIPCGDSGALAVALRRYLDDPALAKAHGAAGREHVRASFSAERMAARYVELYEQLCAARSGAKSNRVLLSRG